MRLLHSAANTSAQFDDPNLVSCAGLVSMMRLAQDCDLADLVGEHLGAADAAVLAHLDIDSAQRRVYGHAKQGAGFGAAKVGGYTVRLRGLNPLLAAVSTPTRAPVMVSTRLRGGTANSARRRLVRPATGSARRSRRDRRGSRPRRRSPLPAPPEPPGC
jgi:hypothetical protein